VVKLCVTTVVHKPSSKTCMVMFTAGLMCSKRCYGCSNASQHLLIIAG
jgi:hypothetical protein